MAVSRAFRSIQNSYGFKQKEKQRKKEEEPFLIQPKVPPKKQIALEIGHLYLVSRELVYYFRWSTIEPEQGWLLMRLVEKRLASDSYYYSTHYGKFIPNLYNEHYEWIFEVVQHRKPYPRVALDIDQYHAKIKAYTPQQNKEILFLLKEESPFD